MRCKKKVFVVYMLQFKRFNRLRNLMENGFPKGIPNLSKLITLGASVHIFLDFGRAFENTVVWRFFIGKKAIDNQQQIDFGWGTLLFLSFWVRVGERGAALERCFARCKSRSRSTNALAPDASFSTNLNEDEADDILLNVFRSCAPQVIRSVEPIAECERRDTETQSSRTQPLLDRD